MPGSFRSSKIADAQHKAYLTGQGFISDRYLSKSKRSKEREFDGVGYTTPAARSGEEDMLLRQEGKDIASQDKRPGVYAKGKSKRQR
jgi:hypothetical protein